ncbi:hypothetical protein EN858_17610 [Mesorhizobium sp. M4B.F.Ca.ET.215.01.1.1]|uniref:ParB/RepB/Spo0J family partition protein n=1 Tax=unclassified Mesorhizobium TaxID=325217 RepID=UPI000FCC1307|nr:MULTISPECIES: ParB/RepB/Spo0J family partition protein [unclassified Mesorhizobium]RUW72015.1 hypothetical protein EOA31_16595 [Mesorhizobium sp. M4B.F.Ca.ET.049.02.1.2]TGQ10224.1 hypothetical protein EN858_17610 [Mesorhizobium sp. M4B.F.Ca.ET.215.01.1.1]TGQ34062.1 hypothetical protein EN863_033780 [Mesorhizobium sp. M00.F.Ca.ET.220.01.1.1]TGR02763.1 hypothetical protein EN846_17060 [Mesorhizobium sp. M4B.F.Ca.ET.203.01.1.1]TGV25995.1 hypothetical protein EN786_10605 [Mesorhizobium sp. M4B.
MIKKKDFPLIELASIRTDGGTQSRAVIDKSVAFEYSEDIADGVWFPPVIIFHDGEAYWLADGFHRYEAHAMAGKKKIAADIKQGTRRDAILFSVGANATHGLKRSRADKRRAVETLLNDPDWSSWSDWEIARKCNVSNHLVKDVREDLGRNSPSERTYRDRHGNLSSMDTSRIGKANGGDAKSGAAGSEKQAQQAEHDRQCDEARAGLPDAIKQHAAARDEAAAQAKTSKVAPADDLADRVAELEEAIQGLEADNAALKAENAKFGDMWVQYQKGGFDSVIAGKDEEIRSLNARLIQESEDKAGWMKRAKSWQKRATDLGWSTDVVIPIDQQSDEVIRLD